MKRKKFLAAAVLMILVVGTTAWRAAAQQQLPKTADLLTQWQYPDGSGFGTQLAALLFPNFPYRGLQGKTHDPIDKVYAFYRKKATLGLTADHGVNWQNDTETTLLVNQPADDGIGFSAMSAPRKIADSALMIVHQPAQTVIIKLSRDAQDRSETDISVIVDKH